EDDIPLLLPKRYRPGVQEDPDSQDGSTPSAATSTTRSNFSFGRMARGMVDSLIPEPLRPRRVLQKRPEQVGFELTGHLNASTEALYETYEGKHEGRAVSSVYDSSRPWPASTITSEGHPSHEAGEGNLGVYQEEAVGPYDGIDASDTQARNVQATPVQAVAGSDYIFRQNLPFREQFEQGGNTKGKQSEGVSSHAGDGDEDVFVEPAQAAEPVVKLTHTFANKEEELLAQVAALRIPTITSARRKQTPSWAIATEFSPLLQQVGEYVPFDPIDPYHLSGNPKKKTLYGPEGYLGKQKEWRQTQFQKMVTKVGSMGVRVVNSIRRSLDRKSEDKKTELLHGIVMKPNITISLDRETQAIIYSKLELFMVVAANEYLLVQLHHNRFEGNDSIKRFVDYWNEKNRPIVPEFQFDMKTQRDIVSHNIRSFEFTGKYSLDPVLLKTTMAAWASVINQLGVRTFCWPDSAIKKLFHDVYPVLEMLDADAEIMTVFVKLRQLMMELIEEGKKHKKVDQ
ncbi:hypothetical protein BGW36DRAFT_264958, partial [Talaromyces proteolyticus]